MAYKDTFIDLANNEAIAGDTWDEGGLAWHASTPMLGNGAGGLKPSAATPYLGGFMAPADAVGMAVRFKALPGWDVTVGLLHIYYGGTEAISESASGNSARASLSAGFLVIRNLVDSALSDAGCAITAGNEYWLETCVAAVAGGKTLYARLSNHTTGARGTIIAAVSLEFAAALPGKSVHLYTENPNRTYIEVLEVEVLTAPFTLDGAAPDTVPGAPTIGTATLTSSTSASVSCTPPASDGGDAITAYVATSTPGGITGSSANPADIDVTGLTTNTAYTFRVHAVNGVGPGPQSAASNSVTPIVVPAPTGTITTQYAPDGQVVRFVGTATDATSGSYTLTGSGGGTTATGTFPITGGAFDFSVTLATGGSYTATLTVTGPGGTASVSGTSAFTIAGMSGGGEPGGTDTPATAVTLTGPATVTVGVASSAFTVNTNGTRAGSVVVAPSDSGQGGTFTPAAVTLTAGTANAIFTYTAATNGAKSISVTNDGGLTNPGAVAVTASAPADTVKPVMSGAISFSSITASGATASWPAASDAVGVTGYQVKVGGAAYSDIGNVTSCAITGRAAGSSTTILVRAKDAAGNLADPLSADLVTTTRKVSISLVGVDGASVGALTGLRWAWFDQSTPDALLAPTDKGAVEVADGAGLLEINLPNTTLGIGGIGWLMVANSDGLPGTIHKAFSGPVAVS